MRLKSVGVLSSAFLVIKQIGRVCKRRQKLERLFSVPLKLVELSWLALGASRRASEALPQTLNFAVKRKKLKAQFVY